MNQLNASIIDLKAKIENLVHLHQVLKENNQQLHSLNTELQKTIEEQKSAIDGLQNSNLQLINNNNKEQNRLVSETKLKISELVQEIDNCIALLK